ncbi:MAG: CDP-alcohol phosphatidyltransferase family protein [Dehalococcoidia bacterium]
MAGSLDGPVSRYLNRRISVPLAGLLKPTPITPNQVSALALLIALGAAVLIALGANVAGGVLVQVSSIADGVDGDLARAKGMASRFGGLLDAVLDRYADAAIAAGMAWYAFERESWPQPLLVGMVAGTGFLLVSYSRARIETEGGLDVTASLLGFASRDVRLLALAAGAVAGQSYWTLVVAGAVSYGTVCWRLLGFRRGSSSIGQYSPDKARDMMRGSTGEEPSGRA